MFLRGARFLALSAGAAILLTLPDPAGAQLGGLLRKAKDAAAERVAERATGQGQPARLDAAAIERVITYDSAFTPEYERYFRESPNMKAYWAQRAEYERCYARSLSAELAVRRYTKLSEQARLDGKTNAQVKWLDSLNVARAAELRRSSSDECVIPPPLSPSIADSARIAARAVAEQKTGRTDNEMAGQRERIRMYFSMKAAERQEAVASGAYAAEEAAALDAHEGALRVWLTHGPGSTAMPVQRDMVAIAKYQDDMRAYQEASRSHSACLTGAQRTDMPQVPASMQARGLPSEAQQAEIQRLAERADAAQKRGDQGTAMAYAESIRVIMKIKSDPRSNAERQAFARDMMASQKASVEAERRCGLAPEQPIKPPYMR